MSLINKLFKKTSVSTKVTTSKKKEEAKKEPIKEEKKAEAPKKRVVLESKILISSHTAEKL